MLYRDHIQLKHAERKRLSSELQDAKESEKQKIRDQKRLRLKQQQYDPAAAATGDGEFDLADIDKDKEGQQCEVVEGTAICNALVAHMIQARLWPWI